MRKLRTEGTKDTPTPPPPLPWSTIAFRLSRILLITYVLCLALFYQLQDFLVFTGHYLRTADINVADLPPGAQLVQIAARNGQMIEGLFGSPLTADGSPVPDSSTCPTILYFYGNDRGLSVSLSQFEQFRRLGCNVLVPEFVGYGVSPGAPSEGGIYETADAAYDYLLTRDDIDPGKIVAAGWSLGAAAAIDLAAHRPVGGLVTFGAFTSLLDMSDQYLPLFPTHLLLHHRFNNLDKISKLSCPILLCHGLDDGLVPPEMSRRLCASVPAPVRARTLFISAANHDTLILNPPPMLITGLSEFLAPLARTTVANSGS